MRCIPEIRPTTKPPQRDALWGLCTSRAGDRTRTGDVQLGKLAFYQLNYARETAGPKTRRTGEVYQWAREAESAARSADGSVPIAVGIHTATGRRVRRAARAVRNRQRQRRRAT